MLFTPQKSKKSVTSHQEDLSLSLEYSIDGDGSTISEEEDNMEMTESGIILVQAFDPLSTLFSQITRQEYSLIGTYSCYKENNIRINLVSIFNGKVPYWVSDCKYLQELTQTGGVGKIVRFPFRDPILIDITEVKNNPNSGKISRELLINLFGHNLVFLPGLNFLLRYLYLDGNIPNTTNLISPIETMISHSLVINYDNIYVTTIDKVSTRKKYKTDRIYLSKVVATFIDMILTDSDFLDLVSGNYLNTVHSYDLLYNLVLSHIEIQDNTMALIQSIFLNNGTIDKDYLQQLIEKINITRNTTATQLEIPINQTNVSIPDSLTVIDRTPAPVIIRSVGAIRDQVDRIVSTINRGDIPYLELNDIIGSINDLSEYYGLGSDVNRIDVPSSGLLIISPYKEIAIPLTLKSGNTITLTTRNFNLSIFTKSELVEILEVIDTLVIDDRYDHLRAKITEEITKR